MLERVLERTLDRIRDLVGAESASIRLLSSDGQLRVAAIRGPSETPVLLGGVALATRVALARESMLLPGAKGRHDPTRGLVMGAPIMHGEHLLGVLQLGASPSTIPSMPMDLEIVTGFTARVAARAQPQPRSTRTRSSPSTPGAHRDLSGDSLESSGAACERVTSAP